MGKYNAADISKLGWQHVASMLDRKNEKIERKEIIISLMDVRLKDNIEQIGGQAAEIEKLKFCLAAALTDIEKLEDSIRAFESEQKDYEKTTMRLNRENERKAAEIEKLKAQVATKSKVLDEQYVREADK